VGGYKIYGAISVVVTKYKIYGSILIDLVAEQVEVSSFIVTRIGKMASLIVIPPGGTGTFVAHPMDQLGHDAALPSGVIPVWTLSVPTVGTIVADATGLMATVAIDPGAVAGTAFSVVVTASMPDGTMPTGHNDQSVASLEVASFVVERTA